MRTTLISRNCSYLLAAFWLGLCACTANKKPSKAETALANMVKDVAIPLQAQSSRNPLTVNDAAIEQGRQIFGQACAICHGADGRAQTGMGQAMYPPAMDLTSPHVLSWTVGDLFWIIQNGIRFTGMPSWKSTLSDEDTWKLALFIRSLPRSARSAPPPSQSSEAGKESVQDLIVAGRRLYRQEGCFMCHKADGAGGTLGPDLSAEASRNRSDDWLRGHFKDPSAYTKGSVMPPFRNLTDDQLLALIAFLQNQKKESSAEPAKPAANQTGPPSSLGPA